MFLKFLRLLIVMLGHMLGQEDAHPHGEGELKRENVISSLEEELDTQWFEVKGFPGNIGEILDAIRALIDVLVRLLNLLGVFKK